MKFKIEKISIVGVGYVGLPLITELHKTDDLIVCGYDIALKRIEQLKKGEDSNEEEVLKTLHEKSNVIFTSDEGDLANSDVFIVTVPTPIDKFKKPDLSALKGAAEMICRVIDCSDKKRFLVIVESTVYPGATMEVVKPIIDQVNQMNKEEIVVEYGYSPERVSPGKNSKKFTEITKIVSGENDKVRNKVNYIYTELMGCETYEAESIEVAEAAKVLENTQRDLNLALVNECVHIFSKMNIITNQVIDAASTKWNFMNVRPGLVGGHCIGVDPYYLTAKSEELGYNPEVVLAGRRINDGFPRWLAKEALFELIRKLENGLTEINTNKTAFVMGVTFKANCKDTRNSKSVDLIDQLCRLGLKVYWDDPVVSKEYSIDKAFKRNIAEVVELRPSIVFITVGHDEFKSTYKEDLQQIVDSAKIVYDIPRILVDKRDNVKHL